MARVRAPEPAPTVPNGFVASAVRLPTATRNQAGRTEGWQGQAWNYWETVGELRYVSTWIGNVLSRATLVAGKRDGRMIIPLSEGPAVESMQALYGGPQGQSEMLQHLGVHLTVAGEAYVVYRAKGEQWDTLASGKVTQLPGGKLNADFGEGRQVELNKNFDLTIRIWTPNPRDPTRPDSPVRPTLSTLAQITAYDAHIAAQIRSRLAGAGILFLSSEVDFPAPPDADPNATPAQNFMKMLGEAMMTPIADPSDPSALVPIVAMVPTESLGKNEHIKFWSELDNAVVEMRDAAIKRFALGVDVPPEVLLGVADANHWNAWLSEESAVKAHLEPRLGTIAYALTETYLRPSLKGEVPDAEVEDYFVLADTSSIRLRPNRSTEAIALYNLGELSGPALRRETGFQPEDAMGDEESKRWLLRKVATGSTSPEQTQEALRLLGADLGLVAPGGENRPPPDNLRLDIQPELAVRERPALEDAERRQERDRAGLSAACDVLVFRALERAGNRLKNTHPRYDATLTSPTALYQVLGGDPDALLAGAWECAHDVLEPYTDEAAAVIDVLDFYVRGLLSSRRPHSPVVMETLMASAPRSLPVPQQ